MGDYGLLTAEHDNSVHNKKNHGGLIYFAPEYAEFGKASTQTDCYAFGVMLLQLITGLRTEDPTPKGKNLVLWVRLSLDISHFYVYIHFSHLKSVLVVTL